MPYIIYLQNICSVFTAKCKLQSHFQEVCLKYRKKGTSLFGLISYIVQEKVTMLYHSPIQTIYVYIHFCFALIFSLFCNAKFRKSYKFVRKKLDFIHYLHGNYAF